MQISYETTDSGLRWSTTTSRGVELSTVLPRTIKTFADFVNCDIHTGDSDPMYWALNRAFRHHLFGPDWTARYCLGMLVYYNSGEAFKAAEHEGMNFWYHLRSVYPTATRGTERRHFRGDAGKRALASLEAISPAYPEKFFMNLGNSFEMVKFFCEKNLSQFGPYFQLKVCDYMDRCLEIPFTSYEGLEKNLHGDPGKAVTLITGKPVAAGMKQIMEELALLGFKAPPDFTRPLGMAEVESCLCDWRATKYKDNWIGADLIKKRQGLVGLGGKADLFASFIPPVIPQDLFRYEL